MSREPTAGRNRSAAAWGVLFALVVVAVAIVVFLVWQPGGRDDAADTLDGTVPEMPGPAQPEPGAPGSMNWHDSFDAPDVVLDFAGDSPDDLTDAIASSGVAVSTVAVHGGARLDAGAGPLVADVATRGGCDEPGQPDV